MGYNMNNVANPDGALNEQGESNRVARAPWSKTSQARQQAFADLGEGSLPPQAPDATDAAVQKSRTSGLLLSKAGRGRSSTFLGSMTGEPLLGKTMLGGY
jgi:hypothetical protein